MTGLPEAMSMIVIMFLGQEYFNIYEYKCTQ